MVQSNTFISGLNVVRLPIGCSELVILLTPSSCFFSVQREHEDNSFLQTAAPYPDGDLKKIIAQSNIVVRRIIFLTPMSLFWLSLPVALPDWHALSSANFFLFPFYCMLSTVYCFLRRPYINLMFGEKTRLVRAV